MTYHVMKSATAGAGFRPLVAGMRARSVGTIYNIYSRTGLEELSPEDEWAQDYSEFTSAIDEMGVDADILPTDEVYTGSDSSAVPASATDEEEFNKKLMIAGGIGAVVLVAGIAIVATRK